ncbi:MAG: hypothetical protein PSV36_07405 [Algoriphagus sp.]|nr:hypothetical protein [Algoriphagus sp.]
MSRTRNRSQVGDGAVRCPAVFAGVARLFSSFVEFMPAFVWSIWVPGTWVACKVAYGRVFGSAVFAVVVGHSDLIFREIFWVY